MNSEQRRAVRIIKQCISDLQLDLTGYTVLTEVGSHHYVYMPVIAALANAARVFAWTKDSPYGKAADITSLNNEILAYAGVGDSVSYAINERPAAHVAEADIITNSGSVRPLDASLLESTKKTCVIPLMFEAWEIRDADIDIAFCRRKNIKVAGTNESHPAIRVFQYVRILALKLMMNAGMEVMGNKIVVWSGDHFGQQAVEAFRDAGAEAVLLTTSLPQFYKEIEDADAVFICDYSETGVLVGENGLFDLAAVSAINPALTFLHLYGNVDPAFADEFGINVYPKKKGQPQIMTETLAYAGLIPLLRLQAAGLKVAEEMLKQQVSSLSQPITF